MKHAHRYDSLFQFYTEKYSIDSQSLQAQGMAESQLDPCATSPVGAAGLMQFMPATFLEWTGKLKIARPDPYNPEHSIWCAAAYMAWLLGIHEKNYRRAWSAYNWGTGRVTKLVARAPHDWFDEVPKETHDYVLRIESYLS